MSLENDFGGLPIEDPSDWSDDDRSPVGDEESNPYCENCGSCGESGCCSRCCTFCGLYTDVSIVPLDKKGKLGYTIFKAHLEDEIEAHETLFGRLEGTVKELGDIVEPIDEKWDAEEDK